MSHLVYQKETLRIPIRVVDSNKQPVEYNSAIAFELRIKFPTVVRTYSCQYDATKHVIEAIVDRDITTTWSPGSYPFQIWVKFPEGHTPTESEMLYASILKVQESIG